jgi:hypothetical protein
MLSRSPRSRLDSLVLRKGGPFSRRASSIPCRLPAPNPTWMAAGPYFETDPDGCGSGIGWSAATSGSTFVMGLGAELVISALGRESVGADVSVSIAFRSSSTSCWSSKTWNNGTSCKFDVERKTEGSAPLFQ